MSRKTIVFDFDGVIHRYSKGWQGIDNIYDEPVEGIREVIKELMKEYEIVIVSTRCSEHKGLKAIREWLQKYDIQVSAIKKEKPPAVLYIDDRAICFNGNCKMLMEQIANFKSWTEKASKKCSYCGKELFSRAGRKKYCSDECRIRANAEYTIQKRKQEKVGD